MVILGEPTAKLVAPKAEESFYTTNFSRTKGGEKAVNMVELGKKIEEEIQRVKTNFFNKLCGFRQSPPKARCTRGIRYPPIKRWEAQASLDHG